MPLCAQTCDSAAGGAYNRPSTWLASMFLREACALNLQDVLDVAPSGLVPAALRSVKGRRAAARSLVGDIQEHESGAIQEHENERAEVVIVCEPEGTSLMMGGLHPRSVCLSACVAAAYCQLPSEQLLTGSWGGLFKVCHDSCYA